MMLVGFEIEELVSLLSSTTRIVRLGSSQIVSSVSEQDRNITFLSLTLAMSLILADPHRYRQKECFIATRMGHAFTARRTTHQGETESLRALVKAWFFSLMTSRLQTDW